MRALILCFALVPVTAEAELFQITSAPDRVVVHPNVARVGRTVEIDLPAGRHELRLSDLPERMGEAFVDVALTGAVLEARSLRNDPTLTAARLDGSAAVKDARAALDAARAGIALHEDQIGAIQARIDAARAQVAFLEGLGKLDGLSGDQLDAAQLRALGQAIAEDGGAARAAVIAAEAEIRALQNRRKPLEDALTLAKEAYARIVAPYEGAQELSLIVTVSEAGPVTLNVDYFVSDVAWEPSYRFFLEPDTGALAVERLVTIGQETGEDWSGVDLSVTTIPISGQSNPSWVRPRQLVIQDEAVLQKRVRVQSSSPSFSDAAEMRPDVPIAPAPISEEAVASPSFSGAGVTYGFPSTVTVANADSAIMALGGLDFTAEMHARAVPMRDGTAYRMVTLTNDSGERILTGAAELYVDGQIVGNTYLETIEAGAEEELGYGPVHGLQLKRAVLDREEGDRGFIARENRQQEAVRITVENLTGRAWDVTLVDRVPYSEQEDLTIDWTAAPQATRENVEDRRGILEWDLTVPAGATQEIRLSTDVRWPDGYVLR